MTSVEAVCAGIYERTQSFYRATQPHLGPADFGYSILYGPPVDQPPALFIGYQPGGSADDGLLGAAAGNHQGWPHRFAFSDQPWTLARRVRRIFSVEFLDRCTGLNLIFFRAPDVRRYQTVPLEARRAIRRHCETELRLAVRAMRPNLLIFIGLDTLSTLTETRTALLSPKGRVLTSEGVFEGVPAVATLHLSGARMSTADRSAITEWLRSRSV